MPIFQNWCGKARPAGISSSMRTLLKAASDLFYNGTNSQGSSALRQALTALLQNLRLTLSGVSPEQFAFLTAPVQMNQIPLKEELEPQTMHLVVSSVFTILVFFLIFASGTMLMQSATQEKRDRMAEVVLSSIRPGELMQGKILGQFLLGLIQLGFCWPWAYHRCLLP